MAASKQTLRAERYQKKAGWISKSYKLKKEVVESFAKACEKRGVSQAGQLTKMMKNHENERQVIGMKKMFYPAVFHKAEKGGYWITFPDIPECITEGDNMEEAYNMAVDALGLALSERIKDKEELPAASDIDNIKEDGAVVVVRFDLAEYNRKHNSKAVKKTLSIPEWLNEEALAMNINFSQVLQEALMERIGIGYH